MERTMSVEEKIRRAEEIYEKRKQGTSRPVATVNVSDKKDVKLLKKMIIQIVICITIYLIIYAINNNAYPFSEDFTNKAKEILSYDTNFAEIYENIKLTLVNWTKRNENNNESNNKNQEEITPPEESIGGAEESIEQENLEQKNEENIVENEEEKEEVKENLSQEEQDIINTKNTTTFIKPIEGTISSKFGLRENATGRVPKNHTGTDIAANTGTKIKSATDGEVVLASEEGDYGKHLKIQIGDVSIIYAHCNNLYVKQGDKITQGQEIAEVGSTGNSTRSSFTF